MKKTFLLFYLLSFIFYLGEALAYTSEDTDNAKALAEADIIVNHNANPSEYRLDDSITRQEVIGMTLKLKGVPLPKEYDCKGYFTDANFHKYHQDNWVCRAAELAADRGLITRDNPTTRPRDIISKIEALALAWKGSGLTIETNLDTGIFVDSKGVPAQPWQENLLETALASGIITVESTPFLKGRSDKFTPSNEGGSSSGGDGNIAGTEGDLLNQTKYLWKHNDPGTRKEVFAIFNSLLMIKKVRDQTMFLNFSGEVQYRPTKVRIIPGDITLSELLQKKDFSTIIPMISPPPLQYRTEGNTLFLMQAQPGQWGKFTFSSMSTLFGKVFQLYSPYDPYDKAISQMLGRFRLATEDDFYALPYGDLWEKTRDFVEQFVVDEFMNAPLVMPSE